MAFSMASFSFHEGFYRKKFVKSYCLNNSAYDCVVRHLWFVLNPFPNDKY